MRLQSPLLVICIVSLCFLAAGQAQVVREEGVVSIAGLLESPLDYDEYYFEGKGGEILFASIDSSIYQSQGRSGSSGSGGCEDTTGCTDTTSGVLPEGSCSHDTSGGCSHDTSDGCSGSGGPLHAKLELYMETDLGITRLCHAGRPMYPGWQRDPRLICPLPVTPNDAQYTLKVTVGGMGGEDHTTFSEPGTSAIPYLLNVSLRRIAQPGQRIEDVALQSKNKF